MSSIIDRLETWAHVCAQASRKMILLDASAEIQSPQMQGNSLHKHAKEVEQQLKHMTQRFEFADAKAMDMSKHIDRLESRARLAASKLREMSCQSDELDAVMNLLLGLSDEEFYTEYEDE